MRILSDMLNASRRPLLLVSCHATIPYRGIAGGRVDFSEANHYNICVAELSTW